MDRTSLSESTMEKANMKTVIVAAVLAAYVSMAAEAVDIRLTSDRLELLPYEPLALVVSLHNKAPERVSREGIVWVGFRCRKEGGEWKTYQSCGPQFDPPVARQKVLESGELKEFTGFIHIDRSGEPAFRSAGFYEIQAVSPFGESNVLRVEVKIPPGSEEAVKFLGDKELYKLFSWWLARWYYYYEEESTVEKLKRLERALGDLKTFRTMKGSEPYHPWLLLADLMLRWAVVRFEDKPNRDDMLREIGDRYEEEAMKLGSPYRESLLDAVARLRLEDLNDREGAARVLKALRAKHAHGYWRLQADYLLHSIVGVAP